MRLSILQSGAGWAVVDKPSGVLVHPTRPGGPPTLWDALRGYFAYELANGGAISILTRLDRETSGAVLVATRTGAARALALAMRRQEIAKEYLAVVAGRPAWRRMVCEEPILRRASVDPASPTWVEQIVHPDGAPCRTEIEVVSGVRVRGADAAVVRCHPLTGRMHQIRVHLRWLGHPVLGDKLYLRDSQPYIEFIRTGWTPTLAERLLHPRHALHAHRLTFRAPDGPLHRVESPWPEDLDRLTGWHAPPRAGKRSP